MNSDRVISAVKKWVETIVIGLNLCPFAKKVYTNKGVRFAYSDSTTEETLLIHLHAELSRIAEDHSIETTLLIHPNVLQDFNDYNQFLDLTDELLEDMHLSGKFQIASFHPDYQFANTLPTDPENFTNRSPFPILHIINENDLEEAIASYPDISSVPERNQRLMNELGAASMQSLLKSCLE